MNIVECWVFKVNIFITISATSRSCRFLLNNIRRIWLYLTTYSKQLLVQAIVISRLDYCNSLLASLPAYTIQPLQLIQNAAAHLVFNLLKFTHVMLLLVTPLATSCCLDEIQSSDSDRCCSQQDGSFLPTGHHSGLHTSSTTPLWCHRPTCSSCQPYEWVWLFLTA